MARRAGKAPGKRAKDEPVELAEDWRRLAAAAAGDDDMKSSEAGEDDSPIASDGYSASDGGHGNQEQEMVETSTGSAVVCQQCGEPAAGGEITEDIAACKRCWRIAQSFPGIEFLTILKIHSESPSFRLSWQEAAGSLEMISEGGTPEFVEDLSVQKLRKVSVTLSSHYWFILVKEFVRRWSYEPASLGYRVIVLRDEEDNKNIRGTLAKPQPGDSPYMFRVLTISSGQQLVMLNTHCGEARRLREDEPNDVLKLLRQQDISERDQDRINR